MRSSVALVLLGGALAACSDDGPAPPLTFTGAYQDWDSTNENFVGIFEATVTEVGDAANTASTAPNGRVTLTLPGSGITEVTFVQDVDGYLPARYTVEPAAAALGAFEVHGITEARVATF